MKTAIITGASRGIGFAAVGLFLERGWNVTAVSRNLATLEKACAPLKAQFGARLLTLAADAGDETAITRVFEQTVSTFGGLDAVINNAGILLPNHFKDSTTQEWEEMLRVNVMGVMFGCKLALQHMKRGAIVNIASVAGLSGVSKFPKIGAYSVSKYAVVGITEVLAAEAPQGIRVNCVCPAATDTDMLQQAAPGMQTDTKPIDVAKVIYYYADEKQSGKITGEVRSLLTQD